MVQETHEQFPLSVHFSASFVLSREASSSEAHRGSAASVSDGLHFHRLSGGFPFCSRKNGHPPRRGGSDSASVLLSTLASFLHLPGLFWLPESQLCPALTKRGMFWATWWRRPSRVCISPLRPGRAAETNMSLISGLFPVHSAFVLCPRGHAWGPRLMEHPPSQTWVAMAMDKVQ